MWSSHLIMAALNSAQDFLSKWESKQLSVRGPDLSVHRIFQFRAGSDLTCGMSPWSTFLPSCSGQAQPVRRNWSRAGVNLLSPETKWCGAEGKALRRLQHLVKPKKIIKIELLWGCFQLLGASRWTRVSCRCLPQWYLELTLAHLHPNNTKRL